MRCDGMGHGHSAGEHHGYSCVGRFGQTWGPSQANWSRTRSTSLYCQIPPIPTGYTATQIPWTRPARKDFGGCHAWDFCHHLHIIFVRSTQIRYHIQKWILYDFSIHVRRHYVIIYLNKSFLRRSTRRGRRGTELSHSSVELASHRVSICLCKMKVLSIGNS